MNITADVQKLEPGNKVQLIEVDGSGFDGPILRFHAYNLPHTPEEIEKSNGVIKPKPIWWQGNEYGAWPYEVEGMAKNSDGSPARPSLKVANIDGLISSLCLQFDDMVQAKVTIYETFAHYLDAKNFPEGNSTANPDECFKQVYYIDRKTNEVAGESVEFELSSPFDLQGVGRIIRCCISHPVARSKSRPGRSLLIQLRVYKRRVRRNVQGQANSRY